MIPHLYEHKIIVFIIEIKKFVKSLGVELGKVHNVVSFSQEPWMKPYILIFILIKGKTKNEFEKDFYKLMNNAVFGKTMENV